MLATVVQTLSEIVDKCVLWFLGLFALCWSCAGIPKSNPLHCNIEFLHRSVWWRTIRKQ